MIHTLYVSADTEPSELKKLMRKKLMTGGAVIRLDSGLGADDLERIYARFVSGASRHNLAAEVLAQIAAHASLSPVLFEKLCSVGIAEVSRALESRKV